MSTVQGSIRVSKEVGHWAPAGAIAGGALLVWLVVLALVPDPRPLGAPEWGVNVVRNLAGASEPVARLVATLVFRGVGVGMIGVLMALALKSGPARYAAPLTLVGAPAAAVAVKWVNFGYLPIQPQLLFILAVAVLGALAGLVVRGSRASLAALLSVAAAFFLWGTSMGVSADLEEAWRETTLVVIEAARDVPEGDTGLARLTEAAFAFAEENSHGTDPVLPNRAAVLALGVVLGEDRVARVARRAIDPRPKEEREAVRGRVTLRGRHDLSRHFWVSAALSVLSDRSMSLAVGKAKELMDATSGGSGFSFVDMIANKAGIRLTAAATRDARSARAMQMRLRKGVDTDDLLPDIADLPEGLTGDEFQSRFGGLGGEKTRKLLDEIERRLAGRPLLQ